MVKKQELDREKAIDAQLISILEKQKRELVVRAVQKHQEAEANRLFLDQVLSNLSDLLLVVSSDLEIVQAGSEFYRILEYPEKQPGLTLCAVTTASSCQQLLTHLRKGEFRDLESELVSSSGKRIPVTVRGATHVTGSGRVLHMLIASDRRDVYEVLGRMREVQDQLIHSGRLASLGEMAAGIGHELTQPLNTVLLLARNCLKAMEHPEQHAELIRDNLGVIIERINHSSSIIRSMKGFASKAKEQAVPVRINVLVMDVLNFLEAQLELSGITVELDLDEAIAWVLGQEVRIEQVLLNLIQNAVQALVAREQPHLRLCTFRETMVDPQSLTPRVFAAIAVSDNGDGIAPEILEKIFHPFFTTREVGTGMGLGLSIVERIVRGFGGHIKVHSQPGEGATFIVYLPEFDPQSEKVAESGPPGTENR